jgi:excisionase family DNA binding protein
LTRLLNAEEVRGRLDLKNVQTVYRWVQAGKLPAVVMSPRVIRFREEDVDAFIESHLKAS